MRRLIGSVLMTAAMMLAGCSREMQRGECRFHDPDRLLVINPQNRITDHLSLARRVGEPNALYLMTGPASMDGTVANAIRIDVVTGAETEETISGISQTGGGMPPGWVLFLSDEPISSTAPPLIRRRVLRVDFKGTKTTSPAIGRYFGDSRARVFRKELFTGTRRIVFGQKVLVEQDLTRYDHIPGIIHQAAIEPDGDRIACLCVDTATRIGIFTRSRLEAAPQSK